ncbi:isoprenyl transferase [Olivibacter sp. SDN3]|uniref:isoprenyl transferase n=1 Tax=Olivibacter sp. SDN3 TaxID=2764720 RepID=UPI001650F161|nr:isoprenyl transferase [Olivibacter sp. SDN3]QNL50001.1 isoprenyl transferase [Olivibacter sp. SDN3]
MTNIELIDRNKLPQHIAIIMDGNGRWAKEKGKLRVFGHKEGVESVRDVLEGAVDLGVPYLTLYTFSTENWKRPKLEVTALMELLVSSIAKETRTMMKNGVRLNAIGNLDELPSKAVKSLKKCMEDTSTNTKCTLTLALSYSARWEITDAVKSIAKAAVEGEVDVNNITETTFAQYLNSYPLPDPELMIRTSGEKRISNYLLWQLAYAELYFTDKLWPDFRRADLYEAVLEFQNRERRFGLTSEQLK